MHTRGSYEHRPHRAQGKDPILASTLPSNMNHKRLYLTLPSAPVSLLRPLLCQHGTASGLRCRLPYRVTAPSPVAAGKLASRRGQLILLKFFSCPRSHEVSYQRRGGPQDSASRIRLEHARPPGRACGPTESIVIHGKTVYTLGAGIARLSATYLLCGQCITTNQSTLRSPMTMPAHHEEQSEVNGEFVEGCGASGRLQQQRLVRGTRQTECRSQKHRPRLVRPTGPTRAEPRYVAYLRPHSRSITCTASAGSVSPRQSSQ